MKLLKILLDIWDSRIKNNSKSNYKGYELFINEYMTKLINEIEYHKYEKYANIFETEDINEPNSPTCIQYIYFYIIDD